MFLSAGESRRKENLPVPIHRVLKHKCIFDKSGFCVVEKADEGAWIQCDNCKGWLHEQCAAVNATACSTLSYVCCPSLKDGQDRRYVVVNHVINVVPKKSQLCSKKETQLSHFLFLKHFFSFH